MNRRKLAIAGLGFASIVTISWYGVSKFGVPVMLSIAGFVGSVGMGISIAEGINRPSAQPPTMPASRETPKKRRKRA